jgi:hypothetical protein
MVVGMREHWVHLGCVDIYLGGEWKMKWRRKILYIDKLRGNGRGTLLSIYKWWAYLNN